MNEQEAIKDPGMIKKSILVLALVLTGFVLHGFLRLHPASVALAGASLLLFLSRHEDLQAVFAEVEWPTLFFFLGLFIIVGGGGQGRTN